MSETSVCARCQGTGWIIETGPKGPVAKRCACFHERQAAALLEKANIPKRYKDCTLANFEIHKDNDSHKDALAISKKFVVLSPGKTNRNKISALLAKAFSVPEEEVSRILPPGDVEIKDTKGVNIEGQ